MTGTIRSFYSFKGREYCEPCVWKAARETRDRGEPGEYVALHDHTICARCGADNGTTDFPAFGELPLCPKCAPIVTDFPYPKWLRLSLVALLALLAAALVHGRKYFQAGRNMYIGERLVEQRRYAEAVPYLRTTLEIAPKSDKAALLMAKAALLSDDLESAQKAMEGHDKGHFEDADTDEFREVDALWKRVGDAYNKAEEAGKLEEKGEEIEAARVMREAADLYPESARLEYAAEAAEEGAAFDLKDYDRFLALSQKIWKEHPGPETAAGVSSALACKYVITGNAAYKDQAEEMLVKSAELARGDQKSQAALQEYTERIRYRIDKKDIITKQEYDRRFRAAQVKKN